jgi:hypothetical protein
LYMRGAKIGRGGEDVVIVIVFYLSQERWRLGEKKYKDDDFLPSSLCLKGAKTGGRGKHDADHRSSSSFFFIGVTKVRKK